MANEIMGLAGTVDFGNDSFGQEAQSMWNKEYPNLSSNVNNNNVTKSFGETGIMDSISGMMPTLGGLAQLYMQWDQLQAKKDSARDAHNASATQYNNQVSRAKNLGNSVFGSGYQSSQQNVAKSSV